MIIGSGLTIVGGLTFVQPTVANLPNTYTSNYTFVANTIYVQEGPVTIDANVVLSFDPTVEWTVTP